MSITIPGVPEFLTAEQYQHLFESVGFDPNDLSELRFAPEGVHALVVARGTNGAHVIDAQRNILHKHRVFIPVRRESDDKRTTRVAPVKN